MAVTLNHASMLDWLAKYDGPLFDSCVTDPPYELGFMGKGWDSTGIAFQVETWRRVYDALKPGAHLVAFSGTRTYHRMACAIEDAGFEIRDQLAWAYGSGFPKSHDVSKAIDKAAGAEREVVGRKADFAKFNSAGYGTSVVNVAARQSREVAGMETAAATPEAQKWQGWGSALKPAWEPICLARKPLAEKNIAANVLAHGTGAINVDGCRVGTEQTVTVRSGDSGGNGAFGRDERKGEWLNPPGRFPANLCHDGSEDVLAGFPETGVSTGGLTAGIGVGGGNDRLGNGSLGGNAGGLGDSGSAARFFYSAKAGPLDRLGTAHATVKPVDLMRWLCRLITPPGGHILEPFAGSGTTGIAAMAEGFDCTMIELEAEHVADIERKLAYLRGEGCAGIIERHKARIDRKPNGDLGPLFNA
jgi:DNA modification methylase